MNIKEFWKLARFVIVGGTSFLIQAGLYYAFSRFVFTDLPLLASYILAMSISAMQNYVSHRAWTFRDQQAANGSAVRYLIVLFAGLFLNASIFWLGESVLHIFDMIVVVIAGATIPCFTYLAHRFFTFHQNPNKFIDRIIRKHTNSV